MSKIMHCVLFKLDPNHITEQQRNHCFATLTSLQRKIPGIEAITFKTNRSIEQLDQGFTHMMLMQFVDSQARDHYVTHPEHIGAVNQLIAEKIIDVPDGVVVFDYSLDD